MWTQNQTPEQKGIAGAATYVAFWWWRWLQGGRGRCPLCWRRWPLRSTACLLPSRSLWRTFGSRAPSPSPWSLVSCHLPSIPPVQDKERVIGDLTVIYCLGLEQNVTYSTSSCVWCLGRNVVLINGWLGVSSSKRSQFSFTFPAGYLIWHHEILCSWTFTTVLIQLREWQ